MNIHLGVKARGLMAKFAIPTAVEGLSSVSLGRGEGETEEQRLRECDGAGGACVNAGWETIPSF